MDSTGWVAAGQEQVLFDQVLRTFPTIGSPPLLGNDQATVLDRVLAPVSRGESAGE